MDYPEILQKTKYSLRLCESREFSDGHGQCLKQILENQHFMMSAMFIHFQPGITTDVEEVVSNERWFQNEGPTVFKKVMADPALTNQKGWFKHLYECAKKDEKDKADRIMAFRAVSQQYMAISTE